MSSPSSKSQGLPHNAGRMPCVYSRNWRASRCVSGNWDNRARKAHWKAGRGQAFVTSRTSGVRQRPPRRWACLRQRDCAGNNRSASFSGAPGQSRIFTCPSTTSVVPMPMMSHAPMSPPACRRSLGAPLADQWTERGQKNGKAVCCLSEGVLSADWSA